MFEKYIPFIEIFLRKKWIFVSEKVLHFEK